ncbi:MAG: hypothetical protein Q7O66_20030 [Dehalococcoidia bacterium]|nr:hypothetical protein [Dehalococcoidia bacterium]
MDNGAAEVIASKANVQIPVHLGAIRDLGIYLMENLDLDALAADRVYDSLLVIAPLNLTGGAGSPITPVAIV